jgi:hypothetical protein
MKILPFLLALCTLLTACDVKPTAISFLDKVLTVDEFTRQPDLRKRVQSECHRNPGQLGADPNCINADKSAELQLFKFKPPRF